MHTHTHIDIIFKSRLLHIRNVIWLMHTSDTTHSYLSTHIDIIVTTHLLYIRTYPHRYYDHIASSYHISFSHICENEKNDNIYVSYLIRIISHYDEIWYIYVIIFHEIWYIYVIIFHEIWYIYVIIFHLAIYIITSQPHICMIIFHLHIISHLHVDMIISHLHYDPISNFKHTFATKCLPPNVSIHT